MNVMKTLKKISNHVPSVGQAIASLIGVSMVAIITSYRDIETFGIILIFGWITALLLLSAHNFLMGDM